MPCKASEIVKDVAINVGDLGFDFRAGQIDIMPQTVRHCCDIFLSSVALALIRLSSRASAHYREYNGDLILIKHCYAEKFATVHFTAELINCVEETQMDLKMCKKQRHYNYLYAKD